MKNVCPFIEVFCTIFVLACIIARWLLPENKKLDKNEMSKLLLKFLNTGADIIDFFGYIDDPQITSDTIIIRLILSEKFLLIYNMKLGQLVLIIKSQKVKIINKNK